MTPSPEITPITTTATASTSRRTLLRTAGHAAWMVPVVQLAAAAPAFAASPNVLKLDTANSGVTVEGKVVTVAVRLVGSVTRGSTLTFTIPATWFQTAAATPVTVAAALGTGGTNWTFSALTNLSNGDKMVTATAGVAASTSPLITLTYGNNGNGRGDTSAPIAITTLVPGGTSTSYSLAGAPK